MKYIFLLLILSHTSVNAQKNPGPRYAAMGSAGTALQGIWSMQLNPSGITAIEKPEMALAYERHFLDQDISSQTALFTFPYSGNVFGFNVERYGFTEYMELHAGIAYARKLGRSLSLAIGFKYHQLSIAGYGSASAFSAEAGFQFSVNEKLILASHVANPGRSRYEVLSGSNIPVKLSLGAAYRFSNKVAAACDLIKILNFPTDIRLGLEYSLIQHFSLRGGISANPFKQYAGFGFNYNRLSVDAAVSFHPALGYSPQIGLGYEF
ncbi:MAG: hypothetical protein WKF68_04265 [Daejeonella sp.]